MQRNAPAGAWFHETIEVPAGAFSHAILPPQAFTLARDYEAKAEEQRQEFTAELVASFNEAQSAWDAYCEHLIKHGILPHRDRTQH
jgi:hypothetical protein